MNQRYRTPYMFNFRLTKRLQAGPSGERLVQVQTLESTASERILVITSAYTRRYERAKAMRVEDSRMRMEAHWNLDSFKQDLKSLQSSLGDLVALTNVKKSAGTTVKPKNRSVRIKEVHKMMKTDLDTLQAKFQNLHAMMEDNRLHNRRTKKAEEELASVCRALFGAFQSNSAGLQQRNEDGRLSLVSLTPTDQSESGSTSIGRAVAPELAKFYEAVSDYKIMGERESDLAVEHGEQLARREQLMDQEQPLEDTEAEFRAFWQRTFQVSRQDFMRARNALLQAQDLCIEANIEFPSLRDLLPDAEEDQELHRSPRSKERDKRPQRSGQAGSNDEMAPAIPDGKIWRYLVVEGESSQLLSNSIKELDGSSAPELYTEKVGRWIADISLDG